jgi:hypothetical protein
MRIFILDEIVVKPGQAGAYRDAYRSGYMSAAERRGMKLEGAWQNPPGHDFAELETTLYYLWSVDGVAGWWNMRRSKTPEGADERYAKHAWWQDSDLMVVRRDRKFLTAQEGA